VLENPADLDARGRMQLGAAYAGLAIENSMLGGAHSAANPLTAHHDVVHGQAVGLVLPGIVRFNAPAVQESYVALCAAAGLPLETEALATALEEILSLAGLSARLSDFGVSRENISTLAEEAARQWTATFNPRPIAAADFAKLYESLL
jgi:alcohol dehydrogenase